MAFVQETLVVPSHLIDVLIPSLVLRLLLRVMCQMTLVQLAVSLDKLTVLCVMNMGGVCMF